MSVSLAVKLGSREGLKVRSRCGCNLCARQMRSTEPSEMPMALAAPGRSSGSLGAMVRCRACPREGGGQRHHSRGGFR